MLPILNTPLPPAHSILQPIYFSTVSSITGQQLSKPLLLIPKCMCPAGFEGDFCENIVLDECDWKDLDTHSQRMQRLGNAAASGPDLLSKLADEQFFRTFKNRGSPYRPDFYVEDEKAAGFELVLRTVGWIFPKL